MANAFEIRYGSLSVGGSSTAYLLVGKHQIRIARDQTTLDFQVLVKGADRAGFLTAEDAFRDAIELDRQRVRLLVGGVDRHDFDPAENTGLLSQAVARKVGGLDDTDLSALYDVTITVERPGPSARNGLRDSEATIETEESGIRQIVVRGVYTALGASDAYTVADANVDALVDAFITTAGGTPSEWAQLRRVIEPDDSGSLASFLVVEREPSTLRDAQTRVNEGPNGIETITTQATYSAPSGIVAYATARAAMVSESDDFITGVMSGTAAEWEVIDFDMLPNISEQEATCSLTRRRVIFNQAQGVLNSPAVVDPILDVRISPQSGAAYDADTEAPSQAVVFFACSIDEEQASGTSLDALWASNILPNLTAQVATLARSPVQLIEGGPSYGLARNTLRALLRFEVYTREKLFSSLEVRDAIEEGKILTPVWSDNPYDRAVDEVPKRWVRTVVGLTVRISSRGADLLTRQVSRNGPAFGPIRQAVDRRGGPFGGLFTVTDYGRSESSFLFGSANRTRIESINETLVMVRADDTLRAAARGNLGTRAL